MKRLLIDFAAIILAMQCGITAQSQPTRQVRMPEEKGLGVKVTDYSEVQKGFFAAAELAGGYSLEINKKNVGFTELDLIGGYRFCDYLRIGLGLGGRYYIGGHNFCTHEWALPLFVNLRGNFIPNNYYSVVPFWTVDAGTTFPDGFMVRPSIGVRIGQPRSAFVVSLGYMGQTLRLEKQDLQAGVENSRERKFYSFITLKLGYEF